jgi:hypothetical protein
MPNNAEPPRRPGGEPEPVPEPWWIPPDDTKRAFEAELRAETAEGHLLFDKTATAIAGCPACDDVVFRVEDDHEVWFALVHLTWRESREPLPWPGTWRLKLPLAESLPPHLCDLVPISR